MYGTFLCSYELVIIITILNYYTDTGNIVLIQLPKTSMEWE